MSGFKCTSCGNAVKEGARFCNSCGAPVENREPEAAAAAAPAISLPNKLGVKKFIIPAIAAVVALVVIIVAASMLIKPSKYTQAKGAVSIYTIDDEVIVIPNGKSPVKLEGTLSSQARSVDGMKAAVLIDEGDDDGKVLYLVTDKPQKISDGVDAMAFSFSGNGLAYTKDADYDEGTSELCLYSGGKSTTITKKSLLHNRISISPDGKIVAYALNDDDDVLGCYWDGKQRELGKDIQPLAVADGGKYVYYIKNETLYVQKDTNSDSKIKLGEETDSFCFNRDLSQILYNSGSNSYISRGGGEKKKLSGRLAYLVRPDSAASVYANGAQIHAVPSFADMFYVNDSENIVRINSKFETNNVAKGISAASLADDGKTITYLKNDSVHSVNGLSGSPESTKLVDGEVISFAATPKADAVYFVNEDMELYYQKGKGKAVLVSDDYQPDNDFSYSGYTLNGLYGGKKLFFISDYELYVSSGNKGERVKGLEGDVIYVSAGNFGVTVWTDDSGDTCYYRSTDGNSFTLIGSE